jgi:hypothetical protein
LLPRFIVFSRQHLRAHRSNLQPRCQFQIELWAARRFARVTNLADARSSRGPHLTGEKAGAVPPLARCNLAPSVEVLPSLVSEDLVN